MLLRRESKDGMSLLSVGGEVREQDVRRLVSAVTDALQEQPRGVVVDLVCATEVAPAAVLALDGLTHPSSLPQPALVFAATAAAVVSGLSAALVHASRDGAVRHLDQDRVPVPREQVELRFGLDGPAQARAVVSAWADRLGLQDVRDDLTLVVSEMVTNAVRHAGPPVALEIQAEDGRVLIEVSDGSPDPPERRVAPSDAEGGRGLLLVDLLCDDQGVRPDPPGKTVWATVRRSPEAATCTETSTKGASTEELAP